MHFLDKNEDGTMYIIGITGGTASGKTTFVSLLKKRFSEEDVIIISQDDYYKPLTNTNMAVREATNFDHPNAIDFNLFNEHLINLKLGNSINVPNYCFKTHNRLTSTKKLTPKKVAIIEGILILNQPEIKKQCNYTLFIDTPEEIRINRRVKRDITERGRTTESVLNQFKKNIAPMHRKFVAPVKPSVNLIIDGTLDFSSNVDKISDLINKHL